MGRRHLSRVLLVLCVLAAAAPAAAASTIPFRVVARAIANPSGAVPREPFAILGTSRASARRIAARVPSASAQPILTANFRTSIVLGLFGPFGCKDARVRVARVTQSGTMLTVHLSIKPLPPGTMVCLAVYETVRVLVVSRAVLHGTPTKVSVAGP